LVIILAFFQPEGIKMWFKNLRLYRMLQPFNLSEEELDAALQEKPFRKCGSLEPSSLGWDSPLGRQSEKLAHETGASIMVCVRQEEKLLPSAVVTELLEEKVAAIESAEGRPVGKRERTGMKEEIIHDLLPRALGRSSRTFAMIDRTSGWILVDAASANKAEKLISLLRETLGSLPVKPLEVNTAPAAILTEWVRDPVRHTDFRLLDSCELTDTDGDGGVVRCKGQDLASEEIQGHLDAGKQVTKLTLEWDERLAFSLESDLAIKRLKFLDLLQEQAADVATEDEIARFDVTFSLMSLELRRLIPRLLELFGGVAE
jgi:recombination associated protein RdgC